MPTALQFSQFIYVSTVLDYWIYLYLQNLGPGTCDTSNSFEQGPWSEGLLTDHPKGRKSLLRSVERHTSCVSFWFWALGT